VGGAENLSRLVRDSAARRAGIAAWQNGPRVVAGVCKQRRPPVVAAAPERTAILKIF